MNEGIHEEGPARYGKNEVDLAVDDTFYSSDKQQENQPNGLSENVTIDLCATNEPPPHERRMKRRGFTLYGSPGSNETDPPAPAVPGLLAVGDVVGQVRGLQATSGFK
ncbi:MAG: hypothetical protein KDA57_08115 [Planctomycetales bacterium]|nr:hypothetical protein [Planctomycetales bacterium]